MSVFYEAIVRLSVGLAEAWDFFESHGIAIVYGTQEDDRLSFFLSLSPSSTLPDWEHLLSCRPTNIPEIDWDAQWQEHGYRFQEGYVHIDLKNFSKAEPTDRSKDGISTIRLKPGPGFGDLSHITTKMALELLSEETKHAIAIDIGSGSGILSLCALSFGIPFAYGIDIDPEAVRHATENAKLNDLQHRCIFLTPENFMPNLPEKEIVILINMIASEQKVAWDALPILHGLPAGCIASGILESERENYLKETRRRGWFLKKEIRKEGWTAFVFECNDRSIGPSAHQLPG